MNHTNLPILYDSALPIKLKITPRLMDQVLRFIQTNLPLGEYTIVSVKESTLFDLESGKPVHGTLIEVMDVHNHETHTLLGEN